MTSREAIDLLRGNDVPADVVALPEDLLDDPQAEALGVLADVEIDGRRVRMPGLPLTFDGARPRIERGGPA